MNHLAVEERSGTLAGLSLKTLLVAATGLMLFGLYVYILVTGENSLMVWDKLKTKKETLLREGKILKQENQKLQKEFFELKQLEPNS